MKVLLDKGAVMPLSAHDTDAGYDLFSRETKTIPPHGSVVFDTGVHIELPTVKIGGETFLTAGILKSKSGLNVLHNLTSTGTIDVGYTGTIKVKLYNHGDEPYTVISGDKITQLVIYPIIKPKLELVNLLMRPSAATTDSGQRVDKMPRDFIERKCPICGRMFIPAPMHRFKLYNRFVCSYSCKLNYERARKDRRKKEARADG